MRLVANERYWNRARGPWLREVVFRNALSPERALELVCDTEGEVDILTEVPPAAAGRVAASRHATLVACDAVRTVAGVIDREAAGLPLHDVRARQALNLAVDRARLVREAFAGYATPLAGLTPVRVPWWGRRAGPKHDPARAAALWHEAGGTAGRPIRLAAWGDLGPVADRVAADWRAAFGVTVTVAVLRDAAEYESRRRLAERRGPHGWDVLILQQGAQAVESPPLEQHRAVAGDTGEFRAGPVLPAFEALYADLFRHTAPAAQAAAAAKVERFVRDEAVAVFLCVPQALYAVNRHVRFTPYATTFELAECRVDRRHWSRR